eukprot:12695680-Ditylum_brightwellii.AAC.1
MERKRSGAKRKRCMMKVYLSTARCHAHPLHDGSHGKIWPLPYCNSFKTVILVAKVTGWK